MTQLGRRGDGVGVALGQKGLRGVRLHRETAGRIAALAHVAADPDDDASLHDAFVRLHHELEAGQLPTHLCAFAATDALQSVDVTGRSPAELKQHRLRLSGDESTRNGYVQVVEADGGARRWLTHIRHDETVTARWQRTAIQAGFAVRVVEPAPVAVARVLPGGTLAVADTIGAPAWRAIVHEHVVLAAAPVSVSRRVHGNLWVDEWNGAVEPLTDGLLGDAEVAEVLGSWDADRGRDAQLVLVGDPIPQFPETHAWWAPGLAAPLGAAVAAAGLGGRAFEPQHIDRLRADGAGEPWVVFRTGDAIVVEPPARRPSRRQAVAPPSRTSRAGRAK